MLKSKCIFCCVFTHKHTELLSQTAQQHLQKSSSLVTQMRQKTSVNKCNKQNAINGNKLIFIHALFQIYTNPVLFVHVNILLWT